MRWGYAAILSGILGAATAQAQSTAIYTYQWQSGSATPTLDQSEAAMRGNPTYASAGLSFPYYSLSGDWRFTTTLDYRPYGGLGTSPPAQALDEAGLSATTPNFKQVVYTGQPPPVRPCPEEGDPCVISNGNQFQAENDFTWGQITFGRYYNSVRLTKPYAAIDYAWSGSFSQRVMTSALTAGHQQPAASPTASFIVVQNERAHPEFFRQVTPGTSTTPGIFRSTASSGKVLVVKTIQTTPAIQYQWIIYYPDGHREYYDHDGRITYIWYPDDPKKNLVVSYMAATTSDTTLQDYWLPYQVKDGNNRYIQFAYQVFAGDPYKHLKSIYSYWTDSIPGSAMLLTLDYELDASSGLRRLWKVHRGDSTVREYKYGEAANLAPNSPPMPFHLTGIIDENGTRFADLRYDDHGRASASYEGGAALQAGAVIATYTSDTNVSVSRSSGQTVTYAFGSVAADRTFRSPASRTHAGVTLPDGPGFSESWTHGYEDPACVSNDERLCRHVDDHGVTTEYQYDDLFERVRIEGKGTPEQRRIETDYDLVAYRVSQRRVFGTGAGGASELQQKTSYVYGASGQLAARCEFDPQDGTVGAYQCSATVAPPATTKGVRRWIYTYCTGSDAATLSRGCPGAGYLRTSTDPRGYVTTYAYFTGSSGYSGSCYQVLLYQDWCNQAGDLATVVDASGRTTTWTNYYPSGQPKTITDDNVTHTMYRYDGRQRLTAINVGVHDAGIRYGYDGVGNVKTITDSDNVVATFTYDNAHRLTDVTDSVGGRVHYTLDAMGNRTKEETFDSSNVLKRKLARSYDLLNRLWMASDAANHATQLHYDARNNPDLSTDANSIVTRQEWDGLNRLKSSIQNYKSNDASQTGTQNVTTKYQYDVRDNLLQVTDPQNLATLYTYDGLNNLKSLQSPDTGLTSYTYDANGNRLTQTDARGVQSVFDYDGANRLKSISYPSNATLNIGYAYDQPNSVTGCSNLTAPFGRLTQVTDSSGSTAYCYDFFGNVVSKKQTTAGKTFGIAYTYTDARRVKTMTYPSGAVVTFGYDTVGRANAVTYKANATATTQTLVSAVDYLPFGPIGKVTYGDAHTLTKSHNQNYDMIGVASSKATGFQASYQRGNTGEVAGAQQDGDAWAYAYDPLYRLKSGTPATGSVSSVGQPVEAGQSIPDTDPVATSLGSPTGWTRSYSGTGDRLQAIDNYRQSSACSTQTDTYTYATGHHWLGGITSNVVTGLCIGQGFAVPGATPNSTTTAYSNDANGNITSRGDGRTYAYDARNRLASVTSGTTVYSYLINARGERVSKVQRVNGSTTAATYYVYDEQGTLVGEYDANGALVQEYVYLNGEPIALVKGASIAYIETDQLGTPRVALEPVSGFRLWDWNLLMDPFGSAAAQSYASPSGFNVTTNLRFPGQYYDAETGLNYNYLRDYEPSTGRYVESDPMGMMVGPSTYIYANGNSLGFFDPLGAAPNDNKYWRLFCIIYSIACGLQPPPDWTKFPEPPPGHQLPRNPGGPGWEWKWPKKPDFPKPTPDTCPSTEPRTPPPPPSPDPVQPKPIPWWLRQPPFPIILCFTPSCGMPYMQQPSTSA